MTDEGVARVAKGLGHPARVHILHQFRDCTPRMVNDIVGECELAQSTVSEHLRILREADLLFSRKDGPRVWYCLRRSVLHAFGRAVAELAAGDAASPDN